MKMIDRGGSERTAVQHVWSVAKQRI